MWFHLTIVFENGHRTICHGFKKLFEQENLDNLLEILPED